MLTDLELKEKFQLLSNKLKVGLFQEVIDETKILLKKRKHQVFYNLLSLSYQSLGKHEESIEIMELALKANSKNSVICFEPYFMNLSRLITNLRVNGLTKNVTTILGAVSNFDGKSNFKITTEKSYMSKGGKLSEEGQDTNVYKLDTLLLKKFKKKINAIKIDTEGEDFKVLVGAENLIREHKPKIIIEVREENKFEIANFLKSNSYKVFNINNLDNEFDYEKDKIDGVINLFATL